MFIEMFSAFRRAVLSYVNDLKEGGMSFAISFKVYNRSSFVFETECVSAFFVGCCLFYLMC